MQPVLSPPIPFHAIPMEFVMDLPEVPASNIPWDMPRVSFFDPFMSVTGKYSKASIIIPGKKVYKASDLGRDPAAHALSHQLVIPKWIISDSDRKFTSEFWHPLWKDFDSRLLFSTAWHPQTGGPSEVKNRTIEVALRMWTTTNPASEWTEITPALHFSVINTYNRATNCSAN